MPQTISSYLSTLPECGTPSTARLQSIYSDISGQKLSNPTGYQANIAWWRKVLEGIVERGLQPKPDHLVLHADTELVDALRWDRTGKPLALPSVIVRRHFMHLGVHDSLSSCMGPVNFSQTELNASRGLIPLSNFLASPQSIYATSSLPIRIATYVLGKPLWWALEQLNIVGESENPGPYDARWKKARGDYVVLALLEVSVHPLAT